MDDWDRNLEPPEPYKTTDELRDLYCLNDNCSILDKEISQEVEVHYWPDGRRTWEWTCVVCSQLHDTEEVT